MLIALTGFTSGFPRRTWGTRHQRFFGVTLVDCVRAGSSDALFVLKCNTGLELRAVRPCSPFVSDGASMSDRKFLGVGFWKSVRRSLHIAPCALNASRITRATNAISEFDNSVFRKIVRFRIDELTTEFETMATGTVKFRSTETWRTAYEEILDRVPAKRYLSVALIQTDEYWQSEPGRRSIEFNLQLVQHGFYVARIFILDEFFWPPLSKTPDREIFNWISQQHDGGLDVFLVRHSEIHDEQELIRDFGIYGDTAVGYQLTDNLGRTKEFELHFHPNEVAKAEELWKRLMLFAIPYDEIMQPTRRY